MDDQFSIIWKDSGRSPKVKPNPNYPYGKALDMRDNPSAKSCEIKLPYPAKRIGVYIATCSKCGINVACTTAGRIDDPTMMKVNCKIENEKYF